MVHISRGMQTTVKLTKVKNTTFNLFNRHHNGILHGIYKRKHEKADISKVFLYD